MHVMIIGAGIGGLALAQGLTRAGIDVTVFERDRARDDRLQGYRLHLAPYGCRALHRCLPPEVYDLMVATSGAPNTSLAFFTEGLGELLTLDATEIGVNLDDPVNSYKSVSRITLREVLLTGLGDRVSFGKTFERFVAGPDGRVTAFFADGTEATGDLLVGADGTSSKVRTQYLPHAPRIDTGAVALSGKVRLGDEVAGLLPRQFSTGAGMILAPGGYSGFLAVHQFRRDAAGDAVTLSPDPDVDRDPGLLRDNTADYVMWNIVARRERLGGDPLSAEPARVQQLALTATHGWHDNLRQLITMSDLDTVSVFPLRTSRRPEPWQPTAVTVLGDAIHAMPPTAGAGANTAIVDADLLRQELVAVERGQQTVTAAIGNYERAMIDHAFKKVAAANRNLANAVSGSRVALAGFRTTLRLVNRIGPLRRRMTVGIT